MQDFVHCIPTKFIFGKGTHHQVGKEIASLGKKKVMLVHDDFLTTSGLQATITKDLEDAGLQVYDRGGVKPNPRLSLIHEGIATCKKEDIDFLLAAGGGSVIDTTKAIAAGAVYDGDVWDYYEEKVGPVTNALPLAVILTIPATGSESNGGSVVTNEDGWMKRAAGGPALYPKFSILNPELTYTLPPFQTACGLVDMFTHTAERYFTNTPNTQVMDAFCEGLFRSIATVGPKLMADPNNYDLRSEVMWMGTVAHNDTVGVGREQDWGTHNIGHEISGIYDITHGVTMGIILCAWMRYVYKHDPDRFMHYGHYVFGHPIEAADKERLALMAIESTEALFKSLGMKLKLSEYGVDDSRFEEMAEKAGIGRGGKVGFFVPLYKDDIVSILKMAL